MQPNIQLLGLTLPSYGVFIMLGAVLGVVIALFFPYKKELSKEHIVYAFIFAGIGVGVGAKLLYLLQIAPMILKNWEVVRGTKNLIFTLMSGGFVFYGGLIGGIVMIVVYAKAFGQPLWDLLETIIISAPLIHAFGRIGCTAAGCCYGVPYEGDFALMFGEGSVAPQGVSLFPIQPLEAVLNFLVFMLLFLYSRKERRQGRVAGLYVILYSIVRFALEFFRGDIERGGIGILSTSQIISLLLLPLGIYLFSRKRKALTAEKSDYFVE